MRQSNNDPLDHYGVTGDFLLQKNIDILENI
nr:MAG TPA: hypothetical protein [Caudoviricetes sp.]